jgi:hypothetical protein
MDERALFFPILCLCIILLPIAVLNWREGNQRVYKHILYWTIIMLVMFLVGKTIKGTFIPDERSAPRHGALLEDTGPSERHPSQLRPPP